MKKLNEGVRVNIMLDAETDRKLDEVVCKTGGSRSSVIRKMIEQEYAKIKESEE